MINKKISRSLLIILGAILMNLSSITPAFAGPAGVVAVEELNLRAGPATDYATIGVLYKDDIVQILIERDPWNIKGFVRVKVQNTINKSLHGKEGWVWDKYLYVPRPD